MNTIDDFRGDNFFLSNFSPHGFNFMGVWYATNEHFYQAAKATSISDFWAVVEAGTPGRSKRIGRSIPVRPDWDVIKLEVMSLGLSLKFSPGRDITQQLIDTNDAILVEGNTWGDTYWGICEGRGTNFLGRLLMQLRAEILLRGTV